MDKDILQDAKEAFKECVDAESDNRKEALEDLEFARLGKQWPESVQSDREMEGRPCLTINRLPAFIKQVTNDARQSRPSIITKPVGNGSDKETSRILNDLIRNIEIVSSADIVYDTALDFAVTCGVGYFVVRVDYACDDSFDQDILLERVSNPFSVYGDPRSKEATSADWNVAFITDLYGKDEFRKKWKGAETKGFDSDTGDELSGLWYSDGKIQVAEYWVRDEITRPIVKLSDGAVMQEEEYLKIKDLLDMEGVTVEGIRDSKSYEVKQHIVSGTEVLETNPWRGRYIPIVPMYGDEINVNGKRYYQSLVRFAKDPQRMFNYWRTASTELVALAPKAPYIGPVGSFVTDMDKWQSANTKSHAFMEYDPVAGLPAPQRQAFAGVPAGALQEALNASDDMKNIMGLHDASLGARSNETSGKAIMARQREGDVSTFNFIDNRNRAVEHAGRIIVDLIPKIYTVPRILRCIKEDGTDYSVPVNQPVMPEGPPQQPGQPPMPSQTPAYVPAPEKIEGVTKIFDLTTGKYDVSVTTGPSFTSRRDEAATQMMEFIRVFPQAAPLIGDLLAKNLDWPGSDEVADRLKAMLPPQAAGQVPPIVNQLRQQLQQQDKMAREAVGTLQQQLQQATQQLNDKAVETQMKMRDQEIAARKVAIDEQKAETERIKVIGELQQAEKDRIAGIMKSANDNLANQTAGNIQSTAEQPPAM